MGKTQATKRAPNQQVTVTVKGGLVVDVRCPPGVEVAVIDHDRPGGGRHETTWGENTPLNQEGAQ